ncbi:MAG TPA: glycosyltransferase family 4 protein [Phycisphaerales bacterium]|nr:glycosyltransferase family 4 protein [Phycisphaerales bacterium]
MKIAVIGEFEAASHRAHAINVVKTAGGFARLGHRVTVLCRAPSGEAGADEPGEMYAEPDLAWRFIPFGSAPGAALGEAAAAYAAELGAEFVYARSFTGALRCAELGLATALETHAYAGDTNPLLLRAFAATRRAESPLRALVTISPVLAEDYTRRGAEGARVHVVPDGVDVDLFAPPPGRRARPGAGPRAVYAGHLYDYKGIPTVLGAARLLPGVAFDLVGGAPEDIQRVRTAAAGSPNVVVRGAVSHAQVPAHLWDADVLLLPPSAREPSAGWTSPVKLGEYLAAGPPIVASRIPGLRTWVDEPAARWFTPDDPADLARAIGESLAEPPHVSELRRRAASGLAQRYSYRSRAEAILHAAGASAVGGTIALGAAGAQLTG